MENQSTRLVRSIRDPRQLADFGRRLADWLVADMGGGSGSGAPALTESRARALLRVTEVVDDPLLADFGRLIADATAARLAVYDLLHDSGLAESAEIAGFIAASAAATVPDTATVPWLPLAVAAFAWKREYPLSQLDPAAPPDAFSPAGSVLRETAQFLRQQAQRSPTERDRLARHLTFTGRVVEAGPATMDTLPHIDTPVVPAPSVYRPPVPVRYPEVARETLNIEPPTEEPPPVRRGKPLVITEDDMQAAAPPPQRQPPLRVEPPPPPHTPPSPLPPSAVIMPNSPVTNRPSLSVQPRQSPGRRTTGNRMKTTKLRVLVQQVAEGPGLYGVQVHVICRRVRAEVAGTTNADGHFLCELPVKESEGLTYQVEVTWPRDLGGEVERKAITLNADRTEFKLPFYRQYRA